MKAQEREQLLRILKVRFDKHMGRHAGIAWADVQARLEGSRDALRSLSEMEATGGEPDVIGHDPRTGRFTFCDCSPESPAGRRSLCYDREALDARKENKPQGSAAEMAAAMGIDLLTEQEYRSLQKLGTFASLKRLARCSGETTIAKEPWVPGGTVRMPSPVAAAGQLACSIGAA